jgi:hypothetical protein
MVTPLRRLAHDAAAVAFIAFLFTPLVEIYGAVPAPRMTTTDPGMVQADPSPRYMAMEPTVKKDEDDVCLPQGTEAYGRTTLFIAYGSLDECIRSGGRYQPR